MIGLRAAPARAAQLVCDCPKKQPAQSAVIDNKRGLVYNNGELSDGKSKSVGRPERSAGEEM